jgi:hypothetical protein
MLNRRRVPRTRIDVAAKVIAGEPPRYYNCVVRDVSSLGARLEFSDTAMIPNLFELTFDSGRTLRACHVAWRARTLTGVEFCIGPKLSG